MARSHEDAYYLSLGAGENQLPLISAARSMGLKVVAVDRNISAPGMKFCDLKIEESVLNYRKIYYKLLSAVEPTQIAGGYAASYGEALQSFAFLCERLSIIGLSRTLIEAIQDKLHVRRSLVEVQHGSFAQPNFLEVTQSMRREEIEQLGFPLVAKLRRGASKMHVYKLDDWGAVKHFVSRKNLDALKIRGNDFMFEQYIEGDEVIVTGLVQNFNFNLISIHDRIAGVQAPFIDLEHRYPSRYESLSSAVSEIHNLICLKLQLSDTPVVSEWKVVANRLYLVELSAQIPGEHVADFMIPKGAHYSYFENLVRLTLGEKILPVPEKNRQKVTVKYWAQNPGWGEWQEETKHAAFARVLNAKPPKQIQSNLDRYGVAGFIQ